MKLFSFLLFLCLIYGSATKAEDAYSIHTGSINCDPLVDDYGFECHAVEKSDKNNIFYFPKLQLFTLDAQEMSHFIAEKSLFEKWDFNLNNNNNGILYFDIKPVDGDCEIASSYIRVNNEIQFRKLPDYFLSKKNDKVVVSIYTYNPNYAVSPCLVKIDYNIVPIEDLYGSTVDYDVRPEERNNNAKNNSFSISIDLQKYLYKKGYGDFIDLSTVIIHSWNDVDHNSFFTVSSIIANLCASYEDKRFRKFLIKEGYPVRQELRSSRKKEKWRNTILSLQKDMALYQTLYTSGFYEIEEQLMFVPSDIMLCYGPFLRKKLPQFDNKNILAVTYSLFFDENYSHDNNIIDSHDEKITDYFEDIYYSASIAIRKYLQNIYKKDDILIVNEINRPMSGNCGSIIDVIVLAKYGEPRIYKKQNSWGCQNSAGASGVINGSIIGKTYKTTSLSESIELKELIISDVLKQAIENINATHFGEITIVDNTVPQYADIQIIGDRGRVLPDAPAWEASSIQAYVINDEKLLVRVDTSLASKAGNEGPRSLSAYEESAENDYRADVGLFANKIIIEMTKIIKKHAPNQTSLTSD